MKQTHRNDIQRYSKLLWDGRDINGDFSIF